MCDGSFSDCIGGQDNNINESQTENNQHQMLILDSLLVFNNFWITTKQCKMIIASTPGVNFVNITGK